LHSNKHSNAISIVSLSRPSPKFYSSSLLRNLRIEFNLMEDKQQVIQNFLSTMAGPSNSKSVRRRRGANTLQQKADGESTVETADMSMEDSNLENEQGGFEEGGIEDALYTDDEIAVQIAADSQLAEDMSAAVETASEYDDLHDEDENENEDETEDDNEETEDDETIDDGVMAAGNEGHQHTPKIGAVPADKRIATGSIPRTRFADEYKSTLTCEAAIHDPELLPLLAHVNCSYLSSYGNSPTLTELKQHAQSLIVLIKALTVSTNSAFIDNENLGDWLKDAEAFHDGETYDFLNDLNAPYNGPKAPHLQTHHALPLNAVLNTVEIAHLIPTQTACVCAASKKAPLPMTGKPKQLHRGHPHGAISGYEVIREICPTRDAWQTPHKVSANQVSLPYAKHQALIAHANEILELLDHEYSAKGGVLSILPPKEQEEDRKKAETTLLGQLILHMQRLVIRCHDLERLYANATDAMASEAVIPPQTLSALGPDGRKGRELVYPQDRFVLVNAGEDVFSFLSKEFDKKDIADEEVMRLNLRHGVSGEALWRKIGGKEYSRGITAIDIVTRYYRIRGSEKDGQAIKTIFVIPAHAEHPGVKVTREMEKQPTVVSVVKPAWPERQSILEMKHRADLEEVKKLRDVAFKLQRLEEQAQNDRHVYEYERKVKTGEIFSLRRKVEILETVLKKPEAEAKSKLYTEVISQASAKLEEAKKLEAKVEADKEAAKAAKQEAETIRQHLHDSRTQWNRELAAMRAKEKAESYERLAKLKRADEESARVAKELEEKMKATWQKQIQETQVIVEYLKSKKIDLGNVVPPQEFANLGYRNGASIFGDALSGGG